MLIILFKSEREIQMNIKPIAIYLPQFHRVKENDEWWGEGFTEWTAVKDSEPLFEGHNQPRVPLNQNYYDLLSKDTLVMQAKMAKKYGIYGFCFYHYYFENGRKILEKPVENLLKWRDIDINYCFCWANETWARTWSNISDSNAWAEKHEISKESNSGILLKQTYGNEEDWKKHFDYLLPFFKDSRYIKVDNKPMFVFYKTNLIDCINEMLSCWEKWAKNEGFNGIYSLDTNPITKANTSATLWKGYDAFAYPQFLSEKSEDYYINGKKYFLYEDVWNNAIRAFGDENRKNYYGAFVDFDDSPRRGYNGTMLKDANVETFEKYAYMLGIKNYLEGNEFYFFNAWNEWGEGNYLEPDIQNGYGYLEAIQRITNKLNVGKSKLYEEWYQISRSNSYNNKTYLSDYNNKKYKELFTLLDKWMTVGEAKINLASYFTSKGYIDVMIYGMSLIGIHVARELKGSNVNIVCGMDQRKINNSIIKVIGNNNDIPACDAIILSVVTNREKVSNELKKRTDIPIISIVDIINELYDEIGKERSK